MAVIAYLRIAPKEFPDIDIGNLSRGLKVTDTMGTLGLIFY